SLFVLFYNGSNAQTIENIEVVGNKEFTKDEYLKWSGIKTGQQWSVSQTDSIKFRILKSLRNRGFFNSFVNITESIIQTNIEKIELSLDIVEGTPTYIQDLYIYDIDSIKFEFILTDLNSLKGEIFRTPKIEEFLTEILTSLENLGYPFASIIIESVYFHKDSQFTKNLCDVFLSISLEETSIIDEIKITGNNKTENYVILRNIKLSEGEKYSQEKIEDIPKLLNRLRFFEPVEKPTYYLNSQNRGILTINVSEMETNNFDGILGYIPPSNDEQSGFFTGFLNVSLRNILGTERAALFRWQKEDRESQELELRYSEPWLLGFPLITKIGLVQRKQDSTYVQRRLDLDIEYLATNDISASVLLTTESTIPTDPEIRGFTVYNSNSLTAGLNIKIDSRDDILSPSSGIYFLNTYKYSSKRIQGPEEYITSETKKNTSLQKLELDLVIYYKLFSRQVASFGMHAREIRGDFFELSDLYKLGGTRTLRGYRENQFWGNRILWSNLEYRYLLTQRSFIFLFFDSGYYLRNENIVINVPRNSAYKIGYGLGLNIETALGILGISYALAEGETFNKGKIHLGLLNEF
ncbi:outer membrane protein assembly factor, partial [Bacteroidota bacterium]